jgi:hypothetical protein
MTFDQQPKPADPAPQMSPAAPPATQPGMTVPVAPVAPLAPAAPAARPKSRSSRLLDVALALAALVAVGGVAFGVGRATAPVAAAANGGLGTFRNGGGAGFRPDGSFDPNAPGRGGAFALGGGLSIDGTVTSVSADALTLKLANGQNVTFSLDSSTSYHQATAGSASDVAVGDSVSVKVKGGGGRVFNQGGQGGNGGNAPGASPAPGASGGPGGGGLQASDITVTH